MATSQVNEANVAGSVVFLSYILAALLLTGFVVYDLMRKYLLSSNHARHFQVQVQIFSTLSVLSFSVLSYHMINFLLVSYKAWAVSRNDFTVEINSLEDVLTEIWAWLKDSTLFQDFAHTICDTSARYVWTVQALLMTMGWSLYASSEGTNPLAY